MKSSESSPQSFSLAIAALGVVFGDIGTSPLYALRECFNESHGIPLNHDTILGILSLIVWTLLTVISAKYISFIMRADNRGEGGILALLALSLNCKVKKNSKILIPLGLFGAALLYGDGAITPAISVLSAVEGLKVATPVFEPFVIPLTLFILLVLFSFQSQGTTRIGVIFGPIISLYFLVIAVLGILLIVKNPHILHALNPVYGLRFLLDYGWIGFLVLGGVFLVTTGGEALYADMGHFGRRPIRMAWFALCLPALLLNYFGQGALLLTRPEAIENPFYKLAPDWFILPLVVISTAASVIASQALISGVFSLTKQAIQLGYSPRLQIIHTSRQNIGQIYLPQINWALMVATMWLVLTFKSSSQLAAAYGISVSMTMVITTFLMYTVTRHNWGWSRWISLPICVFFITIDGSFMISNFVKIEQGGWFPIALGFSVFFLMTTWKKGRAILYQNIRAQSVPMTDFVNRTDLQKTLRVPGTAVFMVGDAEVTPPALLHNLRHNKVMHETVIILTVITEEVPRVAKADRYEIERLGHGLFKILVRYGFSQVPDVSFVLKKIADNERDLEMKDMTFFLGRETLIPSDKPGMPYWQEVLFAFMNRNAFRATAFFNIPVEQVVEVGMVVEI